MICIVYGVGEFSNNAGAVLFADFFIGHLETKATYESLLKVFPGKRPFIISRSTAPGTGAWAGHWGKALPA